MKCFKYFYQNSGLQSDNLVKIHPLFVLLMFHLLAFDIKHKRMFIFL